jgi:hypothetical protein
VPIAIVSRLNAAGDLRHAARVAHRALDRLRIGLERLMGGEHVVIGGDDRHVRRVARDQGRLVVGRAGRDAMGEIGAADLAPPLARGAHAREPRQIGRARFGAARDDRRGDLAQGFVEGHANSSCQVRPSRSINAVAAAGPQDPAT